MALSLLVAVSGPRLLLRTARRARRGGAEEHNSKRACRKERGHSTGCAVRARLKPAMAGPRPSAGGQAGARRAGLLCSWRALFVFLSSILVAYYLAFHRQYEQGVQQLQAHVAPASHAHGIVHLQDAPSPAAQEQGHAELQERDALEPPEPEAEPPAEPAREAAPEPEPVAAEEPAALGEADWWEGDGLLHPRIFVYEDLPVQFREPCQW